MNTTRMNEWLQIAASLGVIIGLLVVAFEIRQNTTVVRLEHSRALYGMWLDLAGIELESGVDEVFIRAIESPDQLTASDKFKMNSFLIGVISVYDYQILEQGLSGTLIDSTIDEDAARFYFASEYSREWFESAKRWMMPENAEVIARVIEEYPPALTYDEASGLYNEK